MVPTDWQREAVFFRFENKQEAYNENKQEAYNENKQEAYNENKQKA